MRAKSSVRLPDLVSLVKRHIKDPEFDDIWSGKDDEIQILEALPSFFIGAAHETVRLNQSDVKYAIKEVYNSRPILFGCSFKKSFSGLQFCSQDVPTTY